jgi:hypothetical protein
MNIWIKIVLILIALALLGVVGWLVGEEIKNTQSRRDQEFQKLEAKYNSHRQFQTEFVTNGRPREFFRAKMGQYDTTLLNTMGIEQYEVKDTLEGCMRRCYFTPTCLSWARRTDVDEADEKEAVTCTFYSISPADDQNGIKEVTNMDGQQEKKETLIDQSSTKTMIYYKNYPVIPTELVINPLTDITNVETLALHDQDSWTSARKLNFATCPDHNIPSLAPLAPPPVPPVPPST